MAFNIVAGVNNAVYGSVSGSGSYEENAEVTLEVTANDGYRFVQWDDGNTDNPRVFNATADVTLVATLEAIPEYAVTLTVNNNNLGSVSGSGSYREGSTATISATPALHCRFVKWDDNNTDNPRTLTVNAAVTLEAIFETVNWYTITVVSSDDTMGSVTGSGDYDEGDTVTLTAVPETDHKFTGWSDGNTDNPRTFTANQSVSLSAAFEAIVYSDVTIASNDTDLGTVSGATSGNIETGSSITLTATPATDCRFDGWQVDGEMLEDTSTTITLTVAENEMDVIAVFSAIVFYQVNLLSSDTDCGHITVISQTAEPRGVNNNIWPEGTELELQAVCESGGNFLNWGDGDKNTTKYIIVSGNTTIRANFYPVSGLILVTKKILNHTWTTIKNFFAAPTGASKIGVPANNALGATTLADVVNSVGQPGGIAMLNNSGKVAAADIDGTLANDTTGNADTATVADKVGTTTVGSSTEPVYINAGTPTACGTSLAVDITGNAATATTANNVKLTHAVDNNERPLVLGTSGIITDESQGLRIGNPVAGIANNPLRAKAYCAAANTQGEAHIVIGNNIDKTAANNARGSIYMFGTSTYRLRMLCEPAANKDITIATTGSDSRTYTLPDAAGTIALTSSDITGSSASCTGNAATATKATQDGSGNTITSTYATIAKTYDDTTNTSYRGMRGLAGATNAWVRTTSQGIIPYQSGAAGSGHCGLGTSSWYFATAYIDNIYGKLNGNCTGSSASCTGNAATATTATNANNAKLTHTVGNSEYPLVFGSSFIITDAQQALRIGTPSATANQCPLRVKAYCAAANTQGESYIVIGNQLAKASANNSRGGLYLYGTGTAWAKFQAGDQTANKTVTLVAPADVTLTLPSATGTLALTSSNITGSSASCTGNAATATTASACSGNAASATYATNIRVTDTDSNTWYPLVFSTGSAASTNYAARVDADSILVYPGTAPAANTQGNCYLQLGNAKAKATAGNKRGVLRIYGTGTSYTEITSAVASTARSISFPDKAGTVALTSDITATNVTSTKTTDTTNFRCDELKFASGFQLKFIYPKSTSVALGRTADETITFSSGFTFTMASVVQFVDGSQHYEVQYGTLNTKRMFGSFNLGTEGAWSGVGMTGRLTTTSFKITLSSYLPSLVIIAGF